MKIETDENHQPPHEIIIVKRSSGDHDDEHHGGVWKIAFADFMTAMMAFFLVMWLINASNEETKKAVASYFNPIKLMDTTSNPKGVKDPEFGVDSSQVEEDTSPSDSVAVSKWVSSGKAGEDARIGEQELFLDPLKTITRIADEGAASGVFPTIKGSSPVVEADDPSAPMPGDLSDPFDPRTWTAETLPGMNAGIPSVKDGRAESAESESGKTDPRQGDADEADEANPLKAEKPGENDAETPLAEAGTAEIANGTDEEEIADEKPSKALEELKRALERLVAFAGDDFSIEFLEDEGEYKIVLIDETDSGMFAIGSAEPRAALVGVMEGIGEQLALLAEGVVVSGHTDARQYRDLSYDNWRLSSDRAHMAYYMMLRGGLRPGQLERIAGYADTQLRLADDPFSARNRRIEIAFRAS